jgi:hypothetical protein
MLKTYGLGIETILTGERQQDRWKVPVNSMRLIQFQPKMTTVLSANSLRKNSWTD